MAGPPNETWLRINRVLRAKWPGGGLACLLTRYRQISGGCWGGSWVARRERSWKRFTSSGRRTSSVWHRKNCQIGKLANLDHIP